VKLKVFFFNTLYQWMAALSVFITFLYFFFFFFLVRCFSSIPPVYLGALFCAFNEFLIYIYIYIYI
jgi:hypothetical protein